MKALKASGTAKQADYQKLKKERDDALAKITQLTEKVEKMEKSATEKLEQIVELGKAVAGANEKWEDADFALTEALNDAAILAVEARQVKEENARLAKDLADAQRFAAMAMAAAAAAKRAAPPATSEKAKQPQQPLVMGLHPIPQVIGPNARAGIRAEQEAKAALEAPKQQEQPIAPPTPEKTLTERLNESFVTFMAWIKGEGGKVESLQDGKNYCGKVVQMDDLHCVQRVGGGKFAIHALDKLDVEPDMDNRKTEIRYRGGVGQVLGNAPLEPDFPVPGGKGGR